MNTKVQSEIKQGLRDAKVPIGDVILKASKGNDGGEREEATACASNFGI